MTIFTIGHSTRSVAALIALLREARADLLVDVRTIPRSRTNPQFNKDALPAPLAEAGIAYRHVAALGGLRGPAKDGAPSPNGLWREGAFRNYADYALTPAFRAALDGLRQLATEHRPAIMCAEALWWRCHRRIIADHLLAAGEPVEHILAPGKIEPAKLTSGAQLDPAGRVTYPPAPSIPPEAIQGRLL